MLIPYLTDYLLKDILKGNYTCGGAVFVGDDGKVEVSVVSATDISVGGRRCSSFAGMLGALEVES